MRKGWHYVRRLMKRGARAEDAVAASEYAILLALIIMLSMGIIRFIGERFAVLYTIIAEALPAGLMS